MTAFALAGPAPAAARTMLEICVRNATTADALDIVGLWNDGLPPHAACGCGPGTHDWPLSMDNALEWVAGHQRAMRPLWLACVDAAPVALLSFIGFHDRPHCQSTAEIAIHVRHGWRGRGVGGTLLARAIDSAPSLGFNRYLAAIRRDNVASAALFRSHGFRLCGCLPGVMQVAGRRHDLLMFGLELD